MNAGPTITRLWAWTGLWVAALLWAVNMLLGLNLPYDDCVQENHASAIVSLAMLAATGAAAFASWRSARREITGLSSPRTFRFIGAMSALAALVFAFALAMQMVAAWVLTGCER
jgi:phosphoglycerol transferase MdoB-like AlkP superfamily enzyme